MVARMTLQRVGQDPGYLVGINVLLLPRAVSPKRLRLEQIPGMQLSLSP